MDKCLKCSTVVRNHEVGCKVYHTDGTSKGVMCISCSSKKARFRPGTLNVHARYKTEEA